MNGRMYDAVLGRFLSPDNYVQDPYNTQSFNRYGYVWNNPLSYNDPSGEFIFMAIAVGALIGAYIGGAQANGNWNPLKWNWSSGSTWGGVLGGAIIGGVSGGIGAYASVGASALLSAAGITGGILGNALTGLAGGIGGGFFSGFGMSYLPGGDKQGLRNGLKGALLGGISAFILGAGIGALTTPKGHNILTGAELRPRVAPVNLEAKSVSSLKSSTNLRAQTDVPELSTSPPSVQPPVESPQYFKKIIGPDGNVKYIANNQVNNPTELVKYKRIDYYSSAGYKGLEVDDFSHHWSNIIDNYTSSAAKFTLKGGDNIYRSLYQVQGALRGQDGIFEWIVEVGGNVTHRAFIPNGKITGIPNKW
jgi:hypothetical protein